MSRSLILVRAAILNGNGNHQYMKKRKRVILCKKERKKSSNMFLQVCRNSLSPNVLICLAIRYNVPVSIGL